MADAFDAIVHDFAAGVGEALSQYSGQDDLAFAPQAAEQSVWNLEDLDLALFFPASDGRLGAMVAGGADACRRLTALSGKAGEDASEDQVIEALQEIGSLVLTSIQSSSTLGLHLAETRAIKGKEDLSSQMESENWLSCTATVSPKGAEPIDVVLAVSSAALADDSEEAKNLPLPFSVIVFEKEMPIGDVVRVEVGSIIRGPRLENRVEARVADRTFAFGRAVISHESFAFLVNEIAGSPGE